MGWFNDLIGRSAPKQPARRDFSAAALSRLTASWTTTNLSANAEIYRDLDVLRARSRDLFNNNDYAKRFGAMVSANVVGPSGFTFQSRVYNSPEKPDTLANNAIESALDRWSRRGVCDVSGKMSFRDIQHLVIKAAARDGEFLVRKIRGKSAGNPFGFALQVLDIDRLDTKFNRKESGSNDVRMGVEINEFGRPVAYWMKTVHPGDVFHGLGGQQGAERIRIPADEIIHGGIADRPEQVRFIPWMHSAMSRLNNLGGYEEAAVIAARVGAAKMGFFTSPDGSLDAVSDGSDDLATLYHDADPGTFGALPPGYDFKSFDPDYPHAMFAQFVSATLRGVASGLNVAYHSLANDLTSVSFSSIRSGTLDERDQWMVMQGWFIESFLEPVFEEWLRWALTMGQITMPNGSALPAEKIDKFSGHIWQGRRWEWVDPEKDINADIMAIDAGLKAPQDIAAKMGLDYEDVLVKIKQAQDMADRLGVKVGAEKNAPPPPDTSQQDQAMKAMESRALEMQGEIAILRAKLEQPAQQVAPDVNVTVGASATEMRDMLREVVEPIGSTIENLTREVSDMQIVVNVPEQPAPVVNVAAPEVRVENIVEPAAVTLEATLPQQNVVVSMPRRKTETQIITDADGNIVKTVQTEVDA